MFYLFYLVCIFGLICTGLENLPMILVLFLKKAVKLKTHRIINKHLIKKCTSLVTLVTLSGVHGNNVLHAAFFIQILLIVRPCSKHTYCSIYHSLVSSSGQKNGCIISKEQHGSEI
jgi:hypothetical protein